MTTENQAATDDAVDPTETEDHPFLIHYTPAKGYHLVTPEAYEADRKARAN